MGQVIPMPLIYPVNQDGSIEALTLADKPLQWTRLDDTVMGGRSHTHLIDANDNDKHSTLGNNKVQKQSQNHTADTRKTRKHPKKLSFEGTINKTASVGFASVRAKLHEPLVPENKHLPQALAITARGDGLTYKVILMDDQHSPWGGSANSPLWEADLPTRTRAKARLGSQHTWTLPLSEFVPTYMGQPANKDKLKMNPSQITRIGFMLSSQLSNGRPNRTYDTQPDVFDFCLEVHDIKVVPDFEFGTNSILEEEGK